MSDWEIYTHCGALVYVSRDATSFVLLRGYSGGLQFGMSDTLVDMNKDDDGIIRRLKATTQGVESAISVRRIIDDEGQELVKELCPIGDEGYGYIKAVYPDGRTLMAFGIYHSRNENPVEGGQAQGFTFSFAQQEPTIED